jgi:hypothetical protein
MHKYSINNNHLQSPRRKLSFGDGVVEVADRKVRIVLSHVVGLLAIKVLDLLISLPMKLKNKNKLNCHIRFLVKLKQSQETKLSYQFSRETNKKKTKLSNQFFQ